MPATSLGKRTRSGRNFAAPSPISKKLKLDGPVNDENQNPIAAVPKTPSKATKTWVLSSARKPLTPRTPRFRDSASATATPTNYSDSALGLPLKLTATPRTPMTPGSIQTVYHLARQRFIRGCDPMCLVGRDAERNQITNFLQRSEKSQPGGCLYVSGPPGTGKSAMVCEVTKKVFSSTKLVRQIYVNCMSIKSTRELYATILEGLSEDTNMEEMDALSALKKIFLSQPKPARATYVVVLDEVDNLLTIDSDSLYTLFEFALHKSSRLALIGIANALDLTDRFLPRLKSRNLKPELLPFLPYTASQIKEIITSRLLSLLPSDTMNPKFIPFIHPAAIDLCSRKVASHSGDLRRAFEICRRAIDVIETSVKEEHENEVREALLTASPSRSVLGEKKNLCSPRTMGVSPSNILLRVTKSLQQLTVESAPRVSIKHLNKVTAAVFSNGASNRLKTLNLQQKAVLCSLVAVEKKNRNIPTFMSSGKNKGLGMAPTIKELYDAYCNLCKEEDLLHPLSSSEFREVIGSLEALSLVGPVDIRAGSLVTTASPTKRPGRRLASAVLGDEKRVASSVNEQDMQKGLEGPGSGILSKILCGEDALE